LVVIDATDQLHDRTSVRSLIGGGGRVLLQAYTLSGDVNLAAALQVTVERRFLTPPPVYDWGGSSFFSGLRSPLALTDHGFDEDGQKDHVLAGGYGVAGFAAGAQPGEAAVVIGNSGRTIVNGFFLEDVTSSAAAVQFARNEIEFLINTPVPIQLVSPVWLGGEFQMQLSGRAGMRCSLQASSDLRQWTSVTNVTLSAGSTLISVPGSADRTFYRAVTPPAP